jgi:TrmH family RNA methyltransferase
MKNITIIQSLINPKIKHLVALQKKAYRHEHGQFLAQGATVYKTLLEAGLKLHSVFVTAQAYDEHHEMIKPDTMYEITDVVLKKISTETTPSGLVAVFEIPKNSYNGLDPRSESGMTEVESADVTANSLVLHNIQDPGNMGTLIRTAAAMNIKTIFTMQGVDAYHPKVVQATAGTIGFVTIVPTNWPIFYKTYKHLSMCALVVDGGLSPEQINLKNCMLVIGNEGAGLPPDIIRDCHEKLTIPMPGKTESLNAAVAGSIAMYLKSTGSLIPAKAGI